MAFLERNANSGSVSTGYDIDNSCKFESDNTEYLSKTPSSAGNRKTWTFSAWVKRSEITATSNSTGNQHMIFSAGDTYMQFDGNAIWINHRAASENFFLATNRLFRDTSAWYHLVWQCDTTQGTASNRAKLYVNGVQETSFQNSTYDNMSQNYVTDMNNTVEHEVGKYSLHDTTYAGMFNGYMAEIHLVDGTALTPTSFGEFDEDSGIWKPKAYAGSYGTNGFYLDFEDGSNMGNDANGGTDFAETNISAADQSTDTPTNNFMTLNPLDNNWANVPIINEGATNHHSDSANFEGSSGTIAMSSGKWYWEIKTMHSAGNIYMLGIGSTEYGEAVGSQSPHDVLNFAGLYLANSGTEGGLFVTDSTGGSVYRNAFNPGANYSANDIYGFALDLDSSPQTITFYRNGSNINPSSGAALDIAGACSILPVTVRLSIHEREAQCNFGGYTEFSISSAESDADGYGNFEYAPPSGYYAVCTKNLEEYG